MDQERAYQSITLSTFASCDRPFVFQTTSPSSIRTLADHDLEPNQLEHPYLLSFFFLVPVWNSSRECVSLSLCLSPPLSSCLYLSSEDLGGYAVCHLACETDTKSFGCDLFELMVQNIVSTPHTQRQFRRCTGPIQMAHGIPPWSKHTCQALTYSHEHAHAAPCKPYMQHMPKIHTFP